MRYFYLEPEAVGELGDSIIMDTAYHPPKVANLHWMLDSWVGDVLVELFPCFIVTLDVMKKIQSEKLNGVTFDCMQVTISEQFEEFYPDTKIPEFSWMKVIGSQGKEDFGIGEPFKILERNAPFDPRCFTLVVSQRALKLLQSLGISHATVEDFPSNTILESGVR